MHLLLALVAVCAAQTAEGTPPPLSLTDIPAGRTYQSALQSALLSEPSAPAPIIGEVLIQRNEFPLSLTTRAVTLFRGGCTPVPRMDVAHPTRSGRFTVDRLPGTQTVDGLLVTAVPGFVATSDGALLGGTLPAVYLDGVRVR